MREFIFDFITIAAILTVMAAVVLAVIGVVVLIIIAFTKGVLVGIGAIICAFALLTLVIRIDLSRE